MPPAPTSTNAPSASAGRVSGLNTTGGFNLGTRLREITREDVRAAVDRARSVALPPDREVIHLLPQQFILDEQPGIHDPVGMVGNRLEVNLHISTCSGSASQSVITCANRAGLEVTETIFEAIAAAEATLSADERELGVCVIDIGARTPRNWRSSLRGRLRTRAVIPVGGDHFTNDLAVGLHVAGAGGGGAEVPLRQRGASHLYRNMLRLS